MGGQRTGDVGSSGDVGSEGDVGSSQCVCGSVPFPLPIEDSERVLERSCVVWDIFSFRRCALETGLAGMETAEQPRTATAASTIPKDSFIGQVVDEVSW